MGNARDRKATVSSDAAGKTDALTGIQDRQPRTARGERTRQALIAAAAAEFGEKGFHEGSITGITQRAGVALGSFYTYFESKDALFRALVAAMSEQVRDKVAPALATATDPIDAERAALLAFLEFASSRREIYRIIDESEFVDPAGFRAHYQNTADRIRQRLQKGGDSGVMRDDVGEVEAWAIMGMNVFLGLRFGVWDDNADMQDIAERANTLMARGLARPE